MAKINSILERFWEWRLRTSPEFGTMIGSYEHDASLDDLGLGAFQRRQEDCKNFIKELEAINISDISKNDALNVTLLKREIQTFVDGLQHRSYLMPMNNLEGPQLELSRTVGWMKFETLQDYEKLFSRLEAIPTQMAQLIELMREGIKTGYTPPRITVSSVPDQIQSILDMKFEGSSKFYLPFKNIPDSFSEDQHKLVSEKLCLIEEKVKPAFKNVQDFLTKEYLPACRETIACSEFPNGADFYQQVLNFHITCEMSPEEIHQVGLREVQRIRTRMSQVARETGFEGSLEDFFVKLRSDKQNYFEKKEDLLAAYHDLCFNIITPKLPKLFKKVPKATFQIIEVPADAAPNFPGAFYLAPPEDGSRPGTFYVNTYKHEERPKYELPSLALHEAVPGHHLQSALAAEAEQQPSFRRYMEDRRYYEAPGRFAMNTGYMEGWGLYCEFLGEEMEMYTNPLDMFGRLSHEMLRSCRLVVDTGMHALGWSRDKAVQFMTNNTAMSVHDVNAEVTRYITWPGQACGYKIGELKIKELRNKASQTLGDKFDIRDFHDVVLSLGAVPLAVLEDAVMEYINGE